MIDLAWLRTEVARLMNYEIDEPDEDMGNTTEHPYVYIDAVINEACRHEYNLAVNNVDIQYFLKADTVTWASDEQTLTLPIFLQKADIYAVFDETNTTPGYLLWVVDREMGDRAEIFPRDHKTWMWGSSGPGEDKSLYFLYYNGPEELINENDQPEWLAPRFRDLIKWSAAKLAKEGLDDEAPASWSHTIRSLRESYYIGTSKGRPRLTNYAQIIRYQGGLDNE